MPGKIASFAKSKHLVPVVLGHLSPVVHSERVLTPMTERQAESESMTFVRLPEALYNRTNF